MESKDARTLILESLKTKAVIKQTVYDNTKKALENLKIVMLEITRECNSAIKGLDKRIMLEFHDRSKFEAELKVAGDLLIFSMHTNIFDFEHNHSIWKSVYVRKEKMNSYCGVISIYNFLNDSFKYNRINDIGYMIGRIFVNKENHFFVEGKRQLGFLYDDFDEAILDKNNMKKIIESAILYSLEFDLLAPPYDAVAIISVEQMTQRFENAQIQTGKRVGFQFNANPVKDDTLNQ